MGQERDPSLLRILVSTDNHLGVWEKDEERRHDSFRAFEEVLQVAKDERVDLLLLGGDLFHENKPSRPTMVRAMQLLADYCLGDDPVGFQVLSDQRRDFVAGRVNFADPNLNVALPVFTIHGNHDDPAGADNLAAVDVLSTCGLVNYFGKVLLSGNEMGRLELRPVLIQKGDTRLALYGLGSVRDERLGRLFSAPNMVSWLRPSDAGAMADWFNVFVVHQNRVQHGGPGAKNCLRERHIPAFMDLVVWGHEHECIPEPSELPPPEDRQRMEKDSPGFVLQPGSSVATALSEGEARQKHVFLLELRGNEWRTVKRPLTNVRPFVFDSVSLAAVRPPLDPDDAGAIAALLERRVQAMVQQATRDAPEPRWHETERRRAEAAAAAAEAAGEAPLPPQQGPAPWERPVLPLVRLRVDYTGFTTVNSQRFGQKFVGKVANPNDILLWAKAPARRAKKDGGDGDEQEDAAALATGLGLTSLRVGGGTEAADQARIEDLVAANLTARLEILAPDELALALHDFVEKDEKVALQACVTNALKETQQSALTRPDADGGGGGGAGEDDVRAPLKEEDVATVVNLCVASRQQASKSGAQQQRQQQQQLGTPSVAGGAGAGGAGGGGGGGAGDSDDWPDADGGGAGPGTAAVAAAAAAAATAAMPPPAPRGRPRKGAAAGAASGGRQASLAEAFQRGSQQQPLQASPVGRTGSNLQGALPFGDAPGPSQQTHSSSRSRTAAAGSQRGRGRGRGRASARGGAAGGRKRTAATAALDSDDEEEAEAISDDDDDGDGDDVRAAQPPAKRSRPQRTAAARRPAYVEAGGGGDDDDDDDDASDDDARPTRSNRSGSQRSRGGGGASEGGLSSGGVEPESIELSSDDDDGGGGGRGGGGGGGGSRGRAGSHGRPAAAAAAPPRRGGGGGRPPPPVNDGSIVVSDDGDDDGAAAAAAAAAPPRARPQPAAAAGPARPASSAGGGGARRRVLPSSISGGRSQG